jgi:hypothetical protein
LAVAGRSAAGSTGNADPHPYPRRARLVTISSTHPASR